MLTSQTSVAETSYCETLQLIIDLVFSIIFCRQQQCKDTPTQVLCGCPAISPSPSMSLNNMVTSQHSETRVWALSYRDHTWNLCLFDKHSSYLSSAFFTWSSASYFLFYFVEHFLQILYIKSISYDWWVTLHNRMTSTWLTSSLLTLSAHVRRGLQ